MNSSVSEMSSSSRETEPLTSNYDALQTASQYLKTDGIFWRNHQQDDMEQSSTTRSYPPASAFHTQAHMQRRGFGTPDRSSDETSASGISWNSVNANSQISSWTASLASYSGYMVPWQEETANKPSSSWDDDDDDESVEEDEEDPNEQSWNEPQPNDFSSRRSHTSSVSKDRTKKSPGLCDFLCQQIEVPIALVYPFLFLIVGLVALCFVIGYQSEKVQQKNPSLASLVLTPVAPPAPLLPTSAPTPVTAAPSMAPSVAATSTPTQCSDNKLTVDKACYVAGDDGILLEFNVCESRESDWVGIYPISTLMLMDDYVEWSWTCGTKLCSASPKMNDFVIDTERLLKEGTYRAFYMRYNNDGTPFASVAQSETFEISRSCSNGARP